MTVSLNLWQHQGTVIASSAGHNPQQPSVIYEGNAKILSGNVFKMWYNDWSGSAAEFSYAESTDGVHFTTYGSNPLISGQGFSKVFKFNGTYYAYTSPSFTSINVYTSTDGITWTLAKTGAIVPGSGGSWDSNNVTQLNVIDVINGTWYGYYTGNSSNTSQWEMGLATSTDGINWTKGASNPVITQWGPSNFDWHKINGLYYGWSQIVLPNNPFATGVHNMYYPSDIIRASSASVLGPFTYLPTPVFQRTQSSEGGVYNGGVPPNGQVADPCLVSDGTNLWIYFTAAPNGDGQTPWMINAAKIPNYTFAQLVQGYEGIQSFPIISKAGLALSEAVLGLDNFQRANESPLSDGGNWVAGTSGDTVSANLVGGVAVGTSISQGAEMYWSGALFNNDQWSSITIAKALESTSQLGVTLRPHKAAFTEYRVVWIGIAGQSGGLYIQVFVNGSLVSTLINNSPLTLQVGDSLTAIINGFTIYVYRNGFLFASVTDGGSNIASGDVGPGPIIYGGTSTASDAAISSWSGGNLVNPSSVGATQNFLGSVRVVSSTPAGQSDNFLGSVEIVGSAPSGVSNPYLGQVKSVSPPIGVSNPLIGQVVVVASAPAGLPDPYLGTVNEE